MILETLTLWQRVKIPTYLDASEITTGKVEFEESKCTRCGLCASCCPVGAIVVSRAARGACEAGELPRLLSAGPDIYMCFACGNCVACCPTGAITLTRRYEAHFCYSRLFREPTMTGPKRY